MQNRFIDLYSDTKSKPSPGMRKAMAEAEVGDEQKYEDPTVERLRERICELLGKEDSVFLPSGTMANQISVRVHCRLGDEVIADRTAHIINAESGGTAANSGVMIRMLDGPNGVFTGEQVKAALRDPNSRNAPRSRLRLGREHLERRLRHGVAARHAAGRREGRARRRRRHAHGRSAALQRGRQIRHQGQGLCRLRGFDLDRLHQGAGRAGRRVAGGLEGVHQGSLAAEADAGRLDAAVRRDRRGRALCARPQLGPPGRGSRQRPPPRLGRRQHQGPGMRGRAHADQPGVLRGEEAGLDAPPSWSKPARSAASGSAPTPPPASAPSPISTSIAATSTPRSR